MMSLASFLLHPIVLILLSVFATVFTIGFTSSRSIFRPAILPLVCLASYLVILNCKERITNFSLASVVAGNGPTYLLAYLDLALLSKWTYDAKGPTHKTSPIVPSKSSDKDQRFSRLAGMFDRLYFGLYTTLSPRHVGTPFEVKNVPSFSSRDPAREPSRQEFLTRSAITILICYSIIDLSSLGTGSPEENARLFAQSNVPLFNEISMEKVAIRIFSTLGLWLNINCFVRLGHSTLAFVFVGSNLSEVKMWRPPFGPLSKIYTVRNFWGIFWHQFFRQTFSSPCDYFVHKILRLPRTGLIQRYTKILATFFISGLFHFAVDLALGMSVFESGAIYFFCTQGFGIMFEDSVQAISHCYAPFVTHKNNRIWTKVLGYVWLVLFMAWSTPVWSYPAIRRNRDPLLPFSVFGFFLRR